MSTTLMIPCPHDALPLTVLSLDFKRNAQRDRERHVHILLNHLARCSEGHEFRVSGDMLLESSEIVRAQLTETPVGAPEPLILVDDDQDVSTPPIWKRVWDFFFNRG